MLRPTWLPGALAATTHSPAREAAPGAPVQNQEPIQLSMEVQNPGDSSLFVWTSRRAYDYDASTHVLTLYLTEQTPPLPPGIVMISNHPRTPWARTPWARTPWARTGRADPGFVSRMNARRLTWPDRGVGIR